MATQASNDGPLRELKHEAVPGYFKAFIIAFALMGLYLAIILVSSPGSAKEHYKSKAPAAKSDPNPSTDGK